MPCGIQDCVCRNVFCGGNGDYSVAGKVHESTATHSRIQIRFGAVSDGASRLILPDSDQGEAQNGEIENGALNQTPLVHTLTTTNQQISADLQRTHDWQVTAGGGSTQVGFYPRHQSGAVILIGEG
jgi:hypothetical protein